MNTLFSARDAGGCFSSGTPFPHIVIDDVLPPEIFEAVSAEFGDPTTNPHWKRYWNPLEKKYALNNFAGKPATQALFQELQSDEVVRRLALLTGIPDLQADPHLHGAGLHYHPRGGKLDMHLDYSVHPISGLERKINLIIYLNDHWEESWGGALELWDNEFTHAVKTILPARNRAVMFRTNDISYHGLPHPISCPDTTGRKSLAVYYVAPISETSPTLRTKAEFRPLPNQPVDDRLAQLYTLRKTRLLTPEDLWDTWESDGKGFW